MDLTEDDIQEFTCLWQEEFGEAITRDAARHHASQLLELFLLLAEHSPSSP
jgi:hypothetical protein